MKKVRQLQKRVKHHHIAIAIIVVALGVVSTSAIAFTVAQMNVVGHIRVVGNPVFDGKGQEPFLPGTDREFVVVTLEVRNASSHEFEFAPVVQTYVSDNKGAKYQMAPATLKNPISAGTLSPYEIRSGELSYNIPKGTQPLYFTFQGGAGSGISYSTQLR